MHSELTLDPLKTALLIVDLQDEQRSEPLSMAADLDKVLANSARLLAAARASGVSVFHAAYVRDFDIRPPRPFEPLDADGGPAFSRSDSLLVAICHEVAPMDGEIVLSKNDASAFEEGSLQSRLEAKGIEWLVVAGVWTEACVAASVRDAISGGFRVLLVKDACTSGTTAMHQVGILNLANRLYGGGVADTDRAEVLLHGATATVWRSTKPVPFRFTLEDAPRLYASL
ncbi:isochorismatase family protein [Rhizobium sp. TH2]|uniref:isochorismatase family protein n=1 Tax=Rhizobium sp. TH2 TaxID=2775403 RepID=UPI0021587108|nr:isochorismatase family protein [Rhizobium sp. TH2]UVC09267.1 isochorismatase family protein [Rhizobium sp. TH2]